MAYSKRVRAWQHIRCSGLVVRGSGIDAVYSNGVLETSTSLAASSMLGVISKIRYKKVKMQIKNQKLEQTMMIGKSGGAKCCRRPQWGDLQQVCRRHTKKQVSEPQAAQESYGFWIAYSGVRTRNEYELISESDYQFCVSWGLLWICEGRTRNEYELNNTIGFGVTFARLCYFPSVRG